MKTAFDFISERVAAGAPPTYREISDAMGCASANSGYAVVTALEERGYIKRPRKGRRIKGKSRALSLAQLSCPHCGEKL
jgi:SOS-response transcriptional repressor LexA